MLRARRKFRDSIKRIRKLDKVARKGGGTQARLDCYEVLYRTARIWVRSSDRKELAIWLDLPVLPPPTVVDLISALMLTATKLDKRLRSRHGAALKYAAVKKIPSGRLVTFLRSRGGFAGAAAKYSRWRRKNSC